MPDGSKLNKQVQGCYLHFVAGSVIIRLFSVILYGRFSLKQTRKTHQNIFKLFWNAELNKKCDVQESYAGGRSQQVPCTSALQPPTSSAPWRAGHWETCCLLSAIWLHLHLKQHKISFIWIKQNQFYINQPIIKLKQLTRIDCNRFFFLLTDQFSPTSSYKNKVPGLPSAVCWHSLCCL